MRSSGGLSQPKEFFGAISESARYPGTRSPTSQAPHCWLCKSGTGKHHRPHLCFLHLNAIVPARCASVEQRALSLQSPMCTQRPIMSWMEKIQIPGGGPRLIYRLHEKDVRLN